MEQFERAERYLARLKEIYAGIYAAQQSRESYEDDVVSFFMHCYHIRDWIIHLNRVGITAEQVDKFIDQHQSLKVCADLCNGSKHCKLTKKTRSGAQPHVATKIYETSTWYTGSGGGEVLEGSYSIQTAYGSLDALELAVECMSLWSGFISQLHDLALSKQ